MTMLRKTITFSAPPPKPIDGKKITLSRQTQDSEQVIVTVRPGSSEQEHTYKSPGSESGTGYVRLRGGSPDAYTTFIGWITSEDSTLSHDFEYNEDPEPDDPNKFSVQTYVLEESDYEVHFNERLLQEKAMAQASRRAQPLGSKKQLTTTSSLIRIGERIDMICDRLLPEPIRECRETRLALANLALRSSGKSTQGMLGDCEPPSASHKQKLRPNHHDHSPPCLSPRRPLRGEGSSQRKK